MERERRRERGREEEGGRRGGEEGDRGRGIGRTGAFFPFLRAPPLAEDMSEEAREAMEAVLVVVVALSYESCREALLLARSVTSDTWRAAFVAPLPPICPEFVCALSPLSPLSAGTAVVGRSVVLSRPSRPRMLRCPPVVRSAPAPATSPECPLRPIPPIRRSANRPRAAVLACWWQWPRREGQGQRGWTLAGGGECGGRSVATLNLKFD